MSAAVLVALILVTVALGVIGAGALFLLFIIAMARTLAYIDRKGW